MEAIQAGGELGTEAADRAEDGSLLAQLPSPLITHKYKYAWHDMLQIETRDHGILRLGPHTWSQFAYFRCIARAPGAFEFVYTFSDDFELLWKFLRDASLPPKHITTQISQAFSLREQCTVLSLDEKSTVAGRLEQLLSIASCAYADDLGAQLFLDLMLREDEHGNEAEADSRYPLKFETGTFRWPLNWKPLIRTFFVDCVIPFTEPVIDFRCSSSIRKLFAGDEPLTTREKRLRRTLHDLRTCFQQNMV